MRPEQREEADAEGGRRGEQCGSARGRVTAGAGERVGARPGGRDAKPRGREGWRCWPRGGHAMEARANARGGANGRATEAQGPRGQRSWPTPAAEKVSGDQTLAL